MNDSNPLADAITSELQVLIGQPIGDGWGAADMQIFEFGAPRPKQNRTGEIVEVSDIKLHLQCRWRLVDGRSVLFGRDDLYRPADETIPADQFDWDQQEAVLDVAQNAWFEKHRSSPPIVRDVHGDPYGGFRIELTGGFTLECFPCDSAPDEHWRFFGHRADGSHFVVTGAGIDEID